MYKIKYIKGERLWWLLNDDEDESNPAKIDFASSKLELMQKFKVFKTRRIATKEYAVIKANMSKQEEEKDLKPIKNDTHIKTEKVNMASFIPTIDKKYISRTIVKGIKDKKLLKLAYDKKINLLLIGDTGTGKTHLFRNFCFENQLPYMRVNLNGATTPEDLIGQWVPTTDGFAWKDGVLTTFMRNGGVFVVDEINACSADILFILHSVLDDENKVVLVQKDGEVITAHEDFWLVATMNPDYEGTRPLNSALKDRFRVMMFDYDTKTETKLNVKPKMQELAGKLRAMYIKGELVTPCSTRMLLQYNEDIEIFGKDFAKIAFLSKFDVGERQAVESAFELVVQKYNIENEKEDETETGSNDELPKVTKITGTGTATITGTQSKPTIQ